MIPREKSQVKKGGDKVRGMLNAPWGIYDKQKQSLTRRKK